MAISAAAIIDEVLFNMKLNTTTPVVLNRSDVLRELNNMLRDLTENTYVFVKKDDDAITLVSGTRSYTKPTDCYDILRVYNADKEKIYPVTIEQLDEANREWEDDTGEPDYFLDDYEDANTISFYKKPDSTVAGNYIGIVYRYYATELTDSVTSYLPGKIQNNKQLALDWCLGKLQLSSREIQDQQKAMAYLNAYGATRKKWENPPKAPDKLRIFGIRGEIPQGIQGPHLPDGYPTIKV